MGVGIVREGFLEEETFKQRAKRMRRSQPCKNGRRVQCRARRSKEPPVLRLRVRGKSLAHLRIERRTERSSAWGQESRRI